MVSTKQQTKQQGTDSPFARELADSCASQQQVIRRECDQSIPVVDDIACEVPVAMIYNGISHVVMMASPNDLVDFAYGFSLSEGIVAEPAEILDIDFRYHPDELDTGIELHLSITSRRMAQLKQQRRNLTGRTGCGLCGAESLQQAMRPVSQVPPAALPDIAAVELAVTTLTEQQPLQHQTGAFHGAAWCDSEGNILVIREDVGRHNALDKLLGALLSTTWERRGGFVLISSRASYEMVQKTSHCGIATLVAVSAPTTLAIKVARQAGLNLIGFARPGRHAIYHQADVSQQKCTGD